jgi:Cof subfamily protein (haloacid dehalogenase superfamily)
MLVLLVLLFNGSHAFVPLRKGTTRPSFAAQEGKQPPPSKGDLYSQEDLQAIFDLHNNLQEFRDAYRPTNSLEEIPNIQDLVQQFLQESTIEKEETTKLKNIRAIASDVDGTLLTSNHTMHPRTASALLQILQQVQDPSSPLQFFFLATGKTRPGAWHHMPPELQLLLQTCPGVYIQGLYCVNSKQQVVFEQTLSDESVQAAELFAAHHQLTLLGYQADQLYATQSSHPHHVQDIHSKYGEPEPILVPTFQGRTWHKLILMGSDNEVLQRVYRPLWDDLAEQHGATTTQAVPLMLELLPAGCNKGFGVQRLCHELGIDPQTELLAMGDGENDKEMLEMAAWGIALGNAVSITKDVADVVMTETNNEGAAGIALERFVLQQR